MAASKLNNLMTALKALVRCGAYVIALLLLAVNAYAAQGYFLKRRRSLSSALPMDTLRLACFVSVLEFHQ